MNNPNSQKGISLYMAVIVLAILLGISLGLSSLIVTKIKIIRGMEESVIAFYAADTGIEKTLMSRQDPSSDVGSLDLDGDGGAIGGSCPGSLTDSDDVCYMVTVRIRNVAVLPTDPDYCDSLNFCIKSTGNYKNTRRAVEVRY